MPYIDEMSRIRLDPAVVAADRVCVRSPGELDYLVTNLVIQFFQHNGGENFTNYAQTAGVLLLVILEFYRRVGIPYENKKKAENGDVFPHDGTFWALPADNFVG